MIAELERENKRLKAEVASAQSEEQTSKAL